MIIITLKKFARKAARWLSLDEDSGITAIEYGLVGALIAIAIITALTLTGTKLSGLFSYVAGRASAP